MHGLFTSLSAMGQTRESERVFRLSQPSRATMMKRYLTERQLLRARNECSEQNFPPKRAGESCLRPHESRFHLIEGPDCILADPGSHPIADPRLSG